MGQKNFDWYFRLISNSFFAITDLIILIGNLYLIVFHVYINLKGITTYQYIVAVRVSELANSRVQEQQKLNDIVKKFPQLQNKTESEILKHVHSSPDLMRQLSNQSSSKVSKRLVRSMKQGTLSS